MGRKVELKREKLTLQENEIEGFLEKIVTHLELQQKQMFRKNILAEESM